MLIRCEKCGKPVYWAGGGALVECGYCYAKTKVLPGEASLVPGDLDCVAPIAELARNMTPGADALRVMQLAGDGFSEAELYLCRREAARHERVLAEARELLGHRATIERLDEALAQLEGIPENAQVTEAIRYLGERRETLLRQRRQRQGRRAWVVAAVAVVCIAIATLMYRHHSMTVLQPRRLENARTFAEQDEYEHANTIYSQLIDTRFFVNWDVRTHAREEYDAMLEEWALQLVDQGEYREASEKLSLMGNVDSARRAREKAAMKIVEQASYGDALNMLSGSEGSEELVNELQRLWFDELVRRESYDQAIAIGKDLGGKDLGEQGFSIYDLYALWTDQAIERGDHDEMIRLLGELQEDQYYETLTAFESMQMLELQTKVLNAMLEVYQ